MRMRSRQVHHWAVVCCIADQNSIQNSPIIQNSQLEEEGSSTNSLSISPVLSCVRSMVLLLAHYLFDVPPDGICANIFGGWQHCFYSLRFNSHNIGYCHFRGCCHCGSTDLANDRFAAETAKKSEGLTFCLVSLSNAVFDSDVDELLFLLLTGAKRKCTNRLYAWKVWTAKYHQEYGYNFESLTSNSVSTYIVTVRACARGNCP